MVQGPIYHLALFDDWMRDTSSAYATSTVDKSLEQVGFIHCSFVEQVQLIADGVYRDRPDVLLLQIDPGRLAAQLRVENLEGGDDAFPHIYGPLNRDAVIAVTPVEVLADGRLDIGPIL
jgi:glutathione S-transferase